MRIQGVGIYKGQLGVPLAAYPWYLLCSPGILGDFVGRDTSSP